tara:strand:+ start:757 stop:1185 length:429 start_codon:yes stop_codon:yes gene_type:complete
MDWDNIQSKKGNRSREQHKDKMSELALEVLSLGLLHQKCVERFRESMVELKNSTYKNDAQKHSLVIAWERAAMSTLDLMNKSLFEMYEIDNHYRDLIDERWKYMLKVVADTQPIIMKMVVDEEAKLPAIFDLINNMKDDTNE